MDRDTQDAIKQALHRIAESGHWSRIYLACFDEPHRMPSTIFGPQTCPIDLLRNMGIELALRGLELVPAIWSCWQLTTTQGTSVLSN